MNISVVIPYHKNKIGLISNLINLQNQSVLPKKIVIIDTSTDKSGYEIARTVSYHEVEIVVDVSPVQIYTAWNIGISHCDITNHILIINDDVILPIDFIAVMQYTAEKNRALVYVPETVSREHRSDIISMNLTHQSKSPIYFEPTDWMPGFVFMLSPKAIEKVGRFNDEKYTVWFGDTDYEKRALLWGHQNHQPSLIKVKGTFVYHYGGMSYAYEEQRVLDAISEDRKGHEGYPAEFLADEPKVKSYVCTFCGEVFGKPILLGIHARKTGHKKPKHAT